MVSPSSNLAVWPPALTLCLLALLLRVCGQSWLAAGPFYALVWSVYLLLPLVLAPDYPVLPLGLWGIVLCVLAVCAGDAVVSRPIQKNQGAPCPTPEKDRLLTLPYLRSILLVSILCGILSPIIDLSASGHSVTLLISGDAYLEMAHTLSVERYTQDVSSPWVSRILLIGVYLSPMLGGILFPVHRSRQRFRWDGLLSLGSLLPALFIFVLYTTRAAFILAGILWVAGWLAVRVWMRQEERQPLTSKTAAAFLGSGLLGIVLFGMGQAIREGEAPGMDALWSRITSPGLRAAFFGHVSVFSRWFETSWDVALPTWGRYSLAGLFDLLGLSTREGGLYLDIWEVESGGLTNIHTVFRGLIQDFTSPGALVFLFLIGGVAGHAHHRTGQGHLVWMPILIGFYAFTGDFITSIFNYNSILFAWLLLIAYFWGICLWRSGIRPRRGVSV